MEIQDFDLSRKMPYIRSNNMKIVILGSVVTVLIGITIFSNLYGRLVNKKESVKNNTAVPTGVYVNTGNYIKPETTINPAKENADVELTNFLNFLLQNREAEAEKLIWGKSPTSFFKSFIDQVISQRETIKFSIVETKYIKRDDFMLSYIIVEVSGSEGVTHHRFSMIMTDLGWRIFMEEQL